MAGVHGPWVPNLFLVGAPRAGTTALYNSLAAHPAIYVPREKEPQHLLFADGHGRNLYAYRDARRVPAASVCSYTSHDAYKALYTKCDGHQYLLDGSTLYWVHDYAAASIAQLSPNARIVVVLRDPVARALSHYQFNVGRGEEATDFHTAIQEELRGERRGWWLGGYVHASRYDDRLLPFLRTFGASRVHIMQLQDVIQNPTAEFDRLASFLGLTNRFGPFIGSNEARAYRTPFASWLRRRAIDTKRWMPRLASNGYAVGALRWLEHNYSVKPAAGEKHALTLLRSTLMHPMRYSMSRSTESNPLLDNHE